jgi:nitrogen regulatory protein PII
MKKIEAIIRASKLDGVRDALAQIRVGDLTVEQDLSGAQKKIGVIVSEELVPQAVNTIESAARG